MENPAIRLPRKASFGLSTAKIALIDILVLGRRRWFDRPSAAAAEPAATLTGSQGVRRMVRSPWTSPGDVMFLQVPGRVTTPARHFCWRNPYPVEFGTPRNATKTRRNPRAPERGATPTPAPQTKRPPASRWPKSLTAFRLRLPVFVDGACPVGWTGCVLRATPANCKPNSPHGQPERSTY